MGVPTRLRGATDFDTLDLCDQLVRKTAVYVMNEKRVPKRWRFVYGTKLIEYIDTVREYVTVANDIRATDEEKLEVGKTVHKNFICFSLVERGKAREIMSVKFAERVAHKALCQNVLYPILTRDLIYDNMANQKGKGVHLARKRVKEFLVWYYRRYGLEGYVLRIDF